MSDLEKLSREEKTFLAGCIKTMILADGEIEQPELEDLDRLLRRLDFQDYEKRLAEFEQEIRDEESFYAAAEKIKNPAAQDLILGVAYELTLQSGVPEDSQENLFKNLSRLWGQN